MSFYLVCIVQVDLIKITINVMNTA